MHLCTLSESLEKTFKISGNLAKSAKILTKSPKMFKVFLRFGEGACTGAQKSKKSKIGKSELKHTQNITGVHMKGFYVDSDVLVF